jgi:hypothetical protein
MGLQLITATLLAASGAVSITPAIADSPNPYSDFGPTINPNAPPAGGWGQTLCIGQMLGLANPGECGSSLDLGLDRLPSQIPALQGGFPIPINDLPTPPKKKK